MLKYIHPQGATAIVYPDGSLASFDKNGKAKKTSATAEKLARGHGGWVLVDGEAPDFTVFNSDREKVPGGIVRIPMKFKNGLVSDLPKYIADPNIIMQQKIDGIRAQIVFEKDVAGCWVRSNSGERLKSTSTAPTVLKIEQEFQDFYPSYNHCLDGEIINGIFWAFDLVNDFENTLLNRLDALSEWIKAWTAYDSVVKMLPTAVSATEKAGLVDRVTQNNGEGFIVKGCTSPYTWGGRVEHSLKIKLVDTADCIVVALSTDRDSLTLGLRDSTGTTVPIGKTSTIGKGTFAVGDVVEVEYLYAGANGKLVQPTILRKRDDKYFTECTFGQLKHVNKEVVV